MTARAHRRRAIVVAVAGAGTAALLLAACSSSSPSTATSDSSTPTTTGSSASAAVDVGSSSLGPVLVTSSGQTLYLLSSDSPGASTCSGACAAAWPLLRPNGATPAAGPGVTAKITTIHRSDGTSQLAADSWPLYTYAGDAAAGDVNGQGISSFGGTWYAVTPSGTKATAASTGPSPSTSSSGPGGYGY